VQQQQLMQYSTKKLQLELADVANSTQHAHQFAMVLLLLEYQHY
jgi:hypothetical protein